MTYSPPPYYGPPQPPPRKSNTWIVWLVIGIIGVFCCAPTAGWVAFNPEGTARLVRAVFDVFTG